MKKYPVILLFALSLNPILTVCAKNNPPNVIHLLVDDLGWMDLGYMGSKYYETPNIDKLAEESLVFTNYYAACALCSPTRYSIQTGRYPTRSGITDWIRARFQLEHGEYPEQPEYEVNGDRILKTPSNPFYMEQEEITIAEILKKSGYFTCHLGKWHLGPDDYYPEKQGYDLNIGGCDIGNPVNFFDPYSNEKGVDIPTLKPRKQGEYLEERLSDELCEVIRAHKNQPFYVNMCYYGVHVPLMAEKWLIEKYQPKKSDGLQNNPVYAAMIEHIDLAVGKLIKTLEDENLLDNTIIIFSSDNGGLIRVTGNEPLRAGKGYPYEGGIRVPMFVYWKGKIQAAKSDLPVISTDWLPTICSITGTELPCRAIDGRDISPVFKGNKIEEVPLFWHYPHYRSGNDMRLGAEVPYSIIRDGDWKLIKRYEGKLYNLFNLKDDLSESTDLSEDNPELVKLLNKKLVSWLAETGAKIPIKKN